MVIQGAFNIGEPRQMSKLHDLTGQTFGKLIVIERAENDRRGNAQWLCRCECGNTKIVLGYQLTSGKTRSCGCLVGHAGTHHKTKTRLFNIWQSMKQRCNDVNSENYKNYGARGIRVCKEWQEKFENFESWAIANSYNNNLTIDRIDVNSDYYPENCRWVDMKTQQQNRTNNRLITINNETKCLAEWCRIYHISPNGVWVRTQKGIDIVTAIITPSRLRRKRYNG